MQNVLYNRVYKVFFFLILISGGGCSQAAPPLGRALVTKQII